MRLRANETLGELLKRWRETQGLTQAEAGACVGTDQGRWSRWEAGVVKPSGVFLAKISLASKGELGLPVLVAAIESERRAAG